MADSKITALAALTAADPANDMVPIVDVSDNSMAASGTTKRISINNILACSPSATLASATITGDLTVNTNVLKVDSTNDRVGIGTASPATILDIQSAGGLFARIQNTTSTADAYLLVKNTTGEGFFGINALGPYIYTASALPIVFTTATSERYRIAGDGVATWSNVGGVGGTAMTLNSSGLGVGVASPAFKLDVAASAVRVKSASAYSALMLSSDDANAGTRNWATASNFNNYGDFCIVQSNAIGGNPISAGTTRMTLDASGNLLVGSAMPVASGKVSANTSTGSAARFLTSAGDSQFAAMFEKSSTTNTTAQVLIGFTINNQATGSGQINANGASQAAFGTFSDSRLKENIVSLPSQLANILSLRPVEFDYKDGSGHQIGFVAQEIQEVYSDAVGEQNGFLTVTGWSKTEARLVSAIKELAAKVQALEAKLA